LAKNGNQPAFGSLLTLFLPAFDPLFSSQVFSGSHFGVFFGWILGGFLAKKRPGFAAPAMVLSFPRRRESNFVMG